MTWNTFKNPIELLKMTESAFNKQLFCIKNTLFSQRLFKLEGSNPIEKQQWL